MQFVDLVEQTGKIESILESLTDAQLELVETIITESSSDVDMAHFLPKIVAVVENFDDAQANLIAESVNGSVIMEQILVASNKFPENDEDFISEAQNGIGNIDVEEVEQETAEIPYLSLVTNALTNILGEARVESLPAEMVFDIADATMDFELSENFLSKDFEDQTSELAEAIKEAIENDELDFEDSEYEGETLSEFLSDYESVEDLVEELAQVTEETLAEAVNESAATFMAKAKNACVLVEGYYAPCKDGDKKCRMTKGTKAKAWFAKHELAVHGKNGKETIDLEGTVDAKGNVTSKLNGKLKQHVNAIINRYKSTGNALSKEYIQYVLIPGIIKRMRRKNKHLTQGMKMKKRGMA